MASGTEENKQVSTCIEQSPSLPLPTCEGHASTENNDPIPTNGVSRFDLTYHLSVIKLAPSTGIFRRLSVIDKLLTPAIFVAMVVGIVIGEFVPSVQEAFDTVQFKSVSLPIAIGLIVMMYPVLTKVKYESLLQLRQSGRSGNSSSWFHHIVISLALNWIVAPFVMLGLAWATLPDLPTFRTGVILVGLARCIAMVLVWNDLAGGDREYCALLVVVNSLLQIVLYGPYAVLFINIIGGAKAQENIHVSYGDVAISVLIYLGIPLSLGFLTRIVLLSTPRSTTFLHKTYIPLVSPLTTIGLLYTIVVMFAYQGHHILHTLGPVFRVFVPLILYFCIMWTIGFGMIWWIWKRWGKGKRAWGYEMASVQAFTAASNNFELAIAVAIAVYGVGSDQALAATIGPLVEVPVLLSITWVSVWLQKRLFHVEHEEGEKIDANGSSNSMP
ncbi:hypothetical protein NLI96_g1499 [Meripilus lineatus]|uniref:Arsenical-resistance protein ACR3 n=1 Tax=Meripilus lineatus TaxID=2056292 RepID=A0AAD5VAU1_9APHY|nr:hypothetical protein NLI96_g1499 [Physisporinus lineatus]